MVDVHKRWPMFVGLCAVVVAIAGVVTVAAVRAGRDATVDSGLPAKPADFLAYDVYQTDQGAHDLDPDRARLTGPDFSVAFTAVEITTTVGIDYRAADGYEFLRLSPVQPNRATTPTDDVTATLVIDGRSRPVDLREVAAGGLVVSVRKGHTAVLRVTDRDRTQSLDLRRGRRGADTIPGYYPQVTLSWPDAGYNDIGRTATGGCRRAVNLMLDITPDDSAILPWGPDVGWAAPGRGWLPISYQLTGTPVVTPDYDDITQMSPACATDLNFTWDLTASVAIRTPEGETPPARVAGGGDSGTLVYDVPLTTTTATLVIHPTGTYSGGHPVTWSSPPPPTETTLSAS